MRFLTLILVALFIAGCASTTTTTKREAAPTPVFDWNPPTTAAPASAGVTFGIVGGEYSKEEDWVNEYPFNSFRDNMRSDFNELLTARGFTTTGPFVTSDEMTFPDKKACDLILQPNLEVQLDVGAMTFEEHSVFLGDPNYTINGNATIRGRVTLAVVESLSGTKMWNKSVAIDPTTFDWVGEAKYSTPPAGGFLLRNEPGLQKAIAPRLDAAYNAILAKAWDYLNPEEMAVVRQQAMEVKTKTGYTGS